MPSSLEDWRNQLREEDVTNVRDFLNVSLDYFNRNRAFFAGSGFYIVGSSLTGKTCIAKDEVMAREKDMWKELEVQARTQFGEERVKAYLHSGADGEIRDFLGRGSAHITEEAPRRDRGEYGDIDCVVTGLPTKKIDVNLDMWTNYTKMLRDKFPNAQHPDEFKFWCIGDYHWAYMVQAYSLNIPAKTRPTAIHFMIYEGDMRQNEPDEHGSKFSGTMPEPTLERWKQQQAADELEYLVISEF